uniref:Uncharacterized protein n=1 Tax=Macrostomum lignano TaxID=282301 RepID=A0A1I8F380_9PLAT
MPVVKFQHLCDTNDTLTVTAAWLRAPLCKFQFLSIRGSPYRICPSRATKLQPNSHRNFSKTLQPVGIFNEILTFSEDSPFALAQRDLLEPAVKYYRSLLCHFTAEHY